MLRATQRFTLVLACALAAGCGGDDDDSDDDDDVAAVDAASATPDAAVATPDAAASAAPVITLATWTQEGGCTAGVSSDVTIATTVTDSDTSAGSLVFSGSATGCTGAINSASATITCPQLGAYATTVTVTDPDSNSDTLSFSIGVCVDGSAP